MGGCKRKYKPERSNVRHGMTDPELGQIEKYPLSNLKDNSKEKEEDKK